jgi:predicted RND superfamily exporter protein
MRGVWLVVVAGVLWGAFVAIGLYRAETNIEDFFPWLPDDTPARRHYIEFLEQFGADDVLIVSWEGCVLGDPRLAQLASALPQQAPEWVQDVTTAEQILAQLTAPPNRLTRAEVLDRIRNILVGPDGRTTCLLVHLTSAGMRDRRGAVDKIVQEIVRSLHLPAETLRLGGHPYVGYYSAQQTRDSLLKLSIPVAVCSTLLAWLCLRKRRLMFLTLASSGAAALTSLAIIPWAGYRINGLLSALPSLVYVITTSGVIHVVNYSLTLRRLDREHGRTSTPQEHAALVRSRAWRACLLSSLSTCLGTLSLVWSEFPAIREFGVFGTLGVALTFFVHMGILPVVLARLFPEDASTVTPNPFAQPFGRLFEWLIPRRRPIVLVALGLALLMVWPLFRLEGRFTIDRMFRPGSKFVDNIRWLEEHVGPIDATEVLLKFPADSERGFFQRMRRVQALEQSLAQLPGVASTFSAATFLPPVPESPTIVELLLMRQSLERQRSRLLGGSHLAARDGVETWRVTLRSRLFGGPTRDELMRHVRTRTAEVVAAWDRPPEVIYTGGSEIFYETQHDVLIDFAESLLLAFGLISLMMSLALRDVRAGLLAMFPNMLPCITVFGLLGWIDRGIDIGMTVAGCIALGIAVDNTSHLLMLYRQTLRWTPDRQEALRETYGESATAVFQTSLICGASMLPYVFAALLYLSRFGLLMSALMAAAMLCDLMLTPSLIAGRAGRWFDPPRSPNGPPGSVPEGGDVAQPTLAND